MLMQLWAPLFVPAVLVQTPEHQIAACSRPQLCPPGWACHPAVYEIGELKYFIFSVPHCGVWQVCVTAYLLQLGYCYYSYLMFVSQTSDCYSS